MWHLRCDLNDFVSGGWKLLLAMEKVWCRFRHAPSPVLPLREPKPIHSDSVTQQSVHSSCQVFAVFLQLLVINLKWLASFIRAISTLKNHCHFLRIIWKYMWYWLICFPSFLVFYVAFYLTFYSGILFCIFSDILSGIHSGIYSEISLAFFLTFYLASVLTFFLAFYLTFFSGILSGIYSDILSGMCWGPALHTEIWGLGFGSGSAHWDLEFTVDVRQCPPTEIWSLRLRFGNAHWDPELAVQVWQWIMRSGAPGWGPTVPTEIWSSLLGDKI